MVIAGSGVGLGEIISSALGLGLDFIPLGQSHLGAIDLKGTDGLLAEGGGNGQFAAFDRNAGTGWCGRGDLGLWSWFRLRRGSWRRSRSCFRRGGRLWSWFGSRCRGGFWRRRWGGIGVLDDDGEILRGCGHFGIHRHNADGEISSGFGGAEDSCRAEGESGRGSGSRFDAESDGGNTARGFDHLAVGNAFFPGGQIGSEDF